MMFKALAFGGRGGPTEVAIETCGEYWAIVGWIHARKSRQIRGLSLSRVGSRLCRDFRARMGPLETEIYRLSTVDGGRLADHA